MLPNNEKEQILLTSEQSEAMFNAAIDALSFIEAKIIEFKQQLLDLKIEEEQINV